MLVWPLLLIMTTNLYGHKIITKFVPDKPFFINSYIVCHKGIVLLSWEEMNENEIILVYPFVGKGVLLLYI